MSDGKPSQIPEPPLRVERAVYGGDGLARTAEGKVVFVPYTLPGELVIDGHVVESSPDRTEPRCVHFGVCGGCQYQMASYPAQLRIKQAILEDTLERAGARDLPKLQVVPSPEPYGYRSRIRLRVREVAGELRLGYSQRGGEMFLPITMCPIATPVLWSTAEAVLQVAAAERSASDWLRSASELELTCDAEAAKVQMHLLCAGKTPQKESFTRFAQAVSRLAPVVSAGVSRLHVSSGRPMEELASWGAEGLAYRVGEESFWLKRGSFFQVNRFLVSRMVELVCATRRGSLAWDLFSGVGLFARRLAQQFSAVTAVEASPVAFPELRRGLRRATDVAVQETTLTFLRKAVLQRERPELIVLDPPRAGAGEEACALLLKLHPAEILYVSCDPTTLARDLAVLSAGGYVVAELHMLDLFPQTYHLETVMVLRRTAVAP